MRTLKLCTFTLLTIGWFVLMSGSANAAVCFAGDGTCGGASSFDETYDDPALDAKQQCIDAGYTLASECIPTMGKQIAGYCPYSSEYVTCCGLEYAYSSCQYPLVQDGADARCGKKYKCKCDSDKYKYTVSTCKAINPNAVASGGSCVAVGYKDGASTVDVSYTDCACDRALFPYTEELCSTKYNAKPYGEVCIGEDKGTKYYPACECDRSVYTKTSDNCTYGGDPMGGFCNQLGMIYYKGCCSCGSYLAAGDENGPFDPHAIKTFTLVDGVNKPDGYQRCPCPKGDRFKITKCEEGYSPDVWKADDKDLPASRPIGEIKGSKCEIDPCEKIVALWLRNSPNYAMFDGASSFGIKSSASSDELWNSSSKTLNNDAKEIRDGARIAVVANDVIVSKETTCDGSIQSTPLGSVKTAMCTRCATNGSQVMSPSGSYDAVSYTAAVGVSQPDCRNQYGCYSSRGYRAKNYCYSAGSACNAYDDYGNTIYGTCVNGDDYYPSGHSNRCKVYGKWNTVLETRTGSVYSESCSSGSSGGYGCDYVSGYYQCGYWGCGSSSHPCYGSCGYGCGVGSGGGGSSCSAIDDGGTSRSGYCDSSYICRIYGEFETTSGLCASGRSPGCASWTIQDAPYYSYKRKEGVGLACIRQEEVVSAYHLSNTLAQDAAGFVGMMKEACTVAPKITFQGNTFPIKYEPYDYPPSSTTGVSVPTFTAKGVNIMLSPSASVDEYFISNNIKKSTGSQKYVKFGRAITLENVKLIAPSSTAMVEFNKPISWKTTGTYNQSEYNIYYGAFTNKISSGNIKGVSFNVTAKSTSGSSTSTANNVNALGELRIPTNSGVRPFVQLDFSGGELYNVASTYVYPSNVFYASSYPTYTGSEINSKSITRWNSSVKFVGPSNSNVVNAYGNLYVGTNGSASAIGYTNAAYVTRDIDVTLAGNFVWNLFNPSGSTYKLFLTSASSVAAESSGGGYSPKIQYQTGASWKQCAMRDQLTYFYERSHTDWWSNWCRTEKDEAADYQAICSVSNTRAVSIFSKTSSVYHFREATSYNPWDDCADTGSCGSFNSSCVISYWCAHKNDRVSALECY